VSGKSVVAAPWAARPASERLRIAWQQRHESDYIFHFRSALGWLLLTCGAYSFFIFYQLMRRSEEHNRRRLELLDAAAVFAWEQARAQGVTESLRANFECISAPMRVLGDLATEFRDPALWTALAVITGGVGQYFGWAVINSDLVKHDEAERAIESELAAIYSRLGWQVTPPEPPQRLDRHRIGRRVLATIATLGLYSIWWMRDVIVEGNAHLEQNWRFEDDLARASQSLLAA
jgi:hypothetical protein